jgi:succinate dehydrogenase / fumarate reductase cytochrome b subunit
VRRFYRSTIGKKLVMAVTGLILTGFVIVHMSGNLLIFRGPAAINGYAAALKANPLILWGVRGTLLIALVLHVIAAWQLTRVALDGRPVAYARYEPEASTVASRTMRWGGVALLLFVILHLLHFTTGTIHSDFAGPDVYRNVVVAFRTPLIAGLYLAAMLALGMHLYHGVWSVFQTLGIRNPTVGAVKRRIAGGLALVVYLGFSLVPLAGLLGLLGRGR